MLIAVRGRGKNVFDSAWLSPRRGRPKIGRGGAGRPPCQKNCTDYGDLPRRAFRRLEGRGIALL